MVIGSRLSPLQWTKIHYNPLHAYSQIPTNIILTNVEHLTHDNVPNSNIHTLLRPIDDGLHLLLVHCKTEDAIVT